MRYRQKVYWPSLAQFPCLAVRHELKLDKPISNMIFFSLESVTNFVIYHEVLDLDHSEPSSKCLIITALLWLISHMLQRKVNMLLYQRLMQSKCLFPTYGKDFNVLEQVRCPHINTFSLISNK